ncbi:Hcp family type VI secretion system effector [Limnoglobus roseus]|uniref:Type VI secretion system tube protein Hcp n=1 Tax=Limnoglobus roseus TaxID=2598579 RepID=A0A5C1APQ7_9BACT|nr:type VI secretion system tube protein Hcp [Limnoglobus roseus]QEL19742.1 type VI secretion system tube protein Hcp [Limnoglobus roseus]
MASDYFLEIKDNPGESTDEQFPNTIEVLSWSFGGNNPITISSAVSGASGGKVDFSDFSFSCLMSKASSKLFLNMCNGKTFDEAKIHCRKATGDGGQVEYLTLNMKMVAVSSYSTSGATGGDDRPTENYSLVVGAYKMEYKAQKKDGSIDSSPVITTWSRVKNKADYAV